MPHGRIPARMPELYRVRFRQKLFMSAKYSMVIANIPAVQKFSWFFLSSVLQLNVAERSSTKVLA